MSIGLFRWVNAVLREITNMADDEQHETALEKSFDDPHGFGESQLSASKTNTL